MNRTPSVQPFHRSLVAAWVIAGLVIPPNAWANPLGEAVRHGNVQFERIDGQLRILQASDKAIIDWESFSIGAGELTEFLQPGSRSAALNRVRGSSASAIEGALRANGRVYLINPNGILIGPGGTIDVGGFVASTLDVSDGEFLAGGDLNFAGGSQAGIVNLGSISALDGDVILIAATVENAGTIRAPKGTAALAAGNDVLLAESGAERVFVRGASGGSKANGVTNTGNIEANIAELKAHGGNIYGMAVKNEGRVAATGVTREGGQIFLRATGGTVKTTGTLKARRSDGSGGRIEIDSGADGRTEVGGEVDARGDSGKGGEIVVLGREIDVLPGSLVLADGETGGGSILIGGGLRGEDPAYSNAENVTVGEGATLSANALRSGDGGRVIVFAENSLTFLGNLSATGGPQGGNGGFAELSGKNSVTIPNLAGRINLSALNGRAGTLLFDPIDTTVVAGSSYPIGDSPVTANTLYADDIADFLNNAGSLIVETDDLYGDDFGDITIQNNVGILWSSDNSLTFNAVRDFSMWGGSSIKSTGNGGVTVNAGQGINLYGAEISNTAGGGIGLHAGSSIYIGGDDGTPSLLSVNDGDLSLTANVGGSQEGSFAGITVYGSALSTTGAGDISLIGLGGDFPYPDSEGYPYLNGIELFDDATIASTSSLPSAGTITLQGTGGSGYGFSSGIFLDGGGTSIQSVAGAISLTGFGGDSMDGYALGVYIGNNASIYSTGVAGNAATITITGTGGGIGSGNTGVTMADYETGIYSDYGDITITGTGGGNGAGSENHGVQLINIFDTIASLGEGPNAAKISIHGTGGSGDHNNVGVSLEGFVTVSSVDGKIFIKGEGGSGNGGDHHGVSLFDDVSVIGSGMADIEIEGTGGTGGNNNEGVRIGGNYPIVRTNDGNLAIAGLAGSGNSNGLLLERSDIRASEGGTIHLKGSGSGTGLAISSANLANILGNGSETLILESLGGNVSFASAVNVNRLQFRDSTGASNVSFSLTNSANDSNWISGFGTGTLGAIGSLDYRDADGFQVGAFLDGDGISATGGIKLFSAGGGGQAINITHRVSSLGGLIDIDGHDIQVTNAAVTNTGSGAITMDATRSIQIGDDSTVSVVDGDLTMNAHAGTPISGDFAGISIDWASIQTAGQGDISLTGRGGNDASYSAFSSDGIRVQGGAVIFSTSTNSNAGGIALRGTGGNGGDINSSGVVISGPDTGISSVNGAISITGLGGDSLTNGNFGVYVSNDAGIHSTGLTTDAATITIHGTGGGAGSNNVGVYLRDHETDVKSAYGNISITGIGGGDGTGSDNHGVLIRNLALTVESTGTGANAATITIHGTGGNGSQYNHGVALEGYVSVHSVDGNISIEGIGGAGSLGNNRGVDAYGEVSIGSTGTADILIEGTGGGSGSHNDGVRLHGDAEIKTTDGDIEITGDGGGNSSGSGNRGIRVIGSTVTADGAGGVEMIGHGGLGFSEIDGIQLEDGALVEVKDGILSLAGTAGGTLGIGVMATGNSGDIRATGTGSITISGTGVGAHGVNLSNPLANLGGSEATSVTVQSLGGNLEIRSITTANGPINFTSPAETLIKGSVTATDGDVSVSGHNITANSAITAGNGMIGFQIDDLGSGSSGTIRINHTLDAASGLSFRGGTGTTDTVTYAGYSGSPIVFNFDDLEDIEFLAGPAPAGDELVGPTVSGSFVFTGHDAFNVTGVSITGFENVTGNRNDDLFSFQSGSSLSGHLNGGGGSANELSYVDFGTAVIVNLATGVATAIGGGFSNIHHFTGSPNIDTVTGPAPSSIYNILGPDYLEVAGVYVSGFENLIGGPHDDQFVFHPYGSLTGYLDGGPDYETGPIDTLDYSLRGSDVFVHLGTLPKATATAIGGGFVNVTNFIGSLGDNDSFTGPNGVNLYNLTAPNTFSTSLFTAAGFENLTGGSGADTFRVSPGAGLAGQLAGAGGTDTLNYSTFGGPVTVDIGAGTATGFGGIATLENFIGSAAADTFATAGGNDVFNITANNAGNVNGSTTFTSFENLSGGAGNDRFNFLNQATVAMIDGGAGTDTLFLNDSNLGGNNTYTITANSISRNPTYNFTGIEILQLLLGSGNDTVNSGFFGFTQILDGGAGNDTLNLPGVASLDEGNPIQNVFHLGFEAPRGAPAAVIDLGDILQLQIDQRLGNLDLFAESDFGQENRFNIIGTPELMRQLSGLSGAFSAATVIGQAIILSADGNPYLIFRPFSLDGSGLTPSNLAIAALNESLGADANVELAQAIGFTGGILLFMVDGPYAIDLSGLPADPVVLAALQESLALAAARELFAALQIPIVVGVTGADGPLSIDLDGVPPGQPVIILLTEQLGDPALNELNAALAGGN